MKRVRDNLPDPELEEPPRKRPRLAFNFREYLYPDLLRMADRSTGPELPLRRVVPALRGIARSCVRARGAEPHPISTEDIYGALQESQSCGLLDLKGPPRAKTPRELIQEMMAASQAQQAEPEREELVRVPPQSGFVNLDDVQVDQSDPQSSGPPIVKREGPTAAQAEAALDAKIFEQNWVITLNVSADDYAEGFKSRMYESDVLEGKKRPGRAAIRIEDDEESDDEIDETSSARRGRNRHKKRKSRSDKKTRGDGDDDEFVLDEDDMDALEEEDEAIDAEERARNSTSSKPRRKGRGSRRKRVGTGKKRSMEEIHKEGWAVKHRDDMETVTYRGKDMSRKDSFARTRSGDYSIDYETHAVAALKALDAVKRRPLKLIEVACEVFVRTGIVPTRKALRGIPPQWAFNRIRDGSWNWMLSRSNIEGRKKNYKLPGIIHAHGVKDKSDKSKSLTWEWVGRGKSKYLHKRPRRINEAMTFQKQMPAALARAQVRAARRSPDSDSDSDSDVVEVLPGE